MIGRENFKRYWKAGFFFSVVSSLIYGLLSFVSSLFSFVPLQTIYKIEGLFEIVIPLQPEWMVIIILFAVAVVIVVPWLYGRLIEVFHNEFIIEKKNQTAPKLNKSK